MDDLDRALQRLQSLPVPARLATLEGDVLARIGAERDAASLTTVPVLGFAALVALAVGVAGAALPGTPAEASPASLSAVGAGVPLAPSTLLMNIG
ncbi:MAG: hypothetical protein DCF31_14595 [Alphaproteobacteria bacterium]|nr:MAG: hypothetical protein DCF31_14595 [Alphaproteobacteria bacterium]